MNIRLYIALLVAVLVVHETSAAYNHQDEGLCRFDKYEGGDGSVKISPIPPIEAAVPSSVLANMFGKTPENADKFGLASKGMKLFSTVAGQLSKALKDTAPKLAPCLGLIGMGFGFISSELTNVKPEQIIGEVNKAISKVVEESNRRFELMQEYVGEKIRDLLKETWQDDYRGQFEIWNDCVSMGNMKDVNNCQKSVARSMNALKWRFMFQSLFENNPEGDISKDDIKGLELQLPFLKKWADLHLLVLAALMKTYEAIDGMHAEILFEKYKGDMIEDGKRYIAYMEWAIRKIRKARVDDQSDQPNWTCDGFEDSTWRYWWFPTSRNHGWSKRRCSFKTTTMNPSYCDLTTTYTCEYHCKLCPGLFCKVSKPLEDEHYWFDKDQYKEAIRIKNTYRSNLARNLDTFWEREIQIFIPSMKSIIDDLDVPEAKEEANEKSASSRTLEDRGKNAPKTQKEEKMIEKFEKLTKRKNKDDEKALYGITGKMSMEEYLSKIKENTASFGRKKKN